MPCPPEPFRIKMIERLTIPTPDERRLALERSGYNLFAIPASQVYIDLLTDSGTSAMSDNQWAGMMHGDESYAGAASFFRFEAIVREIFGFEHVIPTHQGRMGESLLFGALLKAGSVVPNNNHFDTTRANVEVAGGEAIDLVVREARAPKDEHPFKGNIDLEALQALVHKLGSDRIPVGMLTITNNSAGGQPVSLANIRATAEILHDAKIPFFLDACRFAENAWFIKEREEGQQDREIVDIVRDMFACADGCIMSAKKDGLANIGGFVALNDRALFEELKSRLVLVEGFPTYGGLAGRDLEAVARGLQEVLDEEYLRYRILQVREFGDKLSDAGIPIIHPVGSHAVYIDAGAMLSHIPPTEFPGQALAVELYQLGAVRGVEIGSLMFGKTDAASGKTTHPALELVRLAIPRRVYTMTQLDYVVEVFEQLRIGAPDIRGLAIVEEPAFLRHFTSKLRRL